MGVTYRDATHGEHFRKTLRSTGLNRSRPSILLTHAPDRVQVSAEEGISLQLSGHTHGGQFFPWNLLVKLLEPFAAGLHRLDGLWVYVSRGTGYWGPPKRFGAPSEITHLRLVPAA